MMPTFRLLAGMAEVVKGAGLKIRSQMGSWVRIPLPAPNLKNSQTAIRYFCKSKGSEQTDPLQPLPTVFGSWMGNRIPPCNLSESIG